LDVGRQGAFRSRSIPLRGRGSAGAVLRALVLQEQVEGVVDPEVGTAAVAAHPGPQASQESRRTRGHRHVGGDPLGPALAAGRVVHRLIVVFAGGCWRDA
jgi:hypothetical protein